MTSDMAGSGGTINDGTGIPGPLICFVKEISALPYFKKAKSVDNNFRAWLSKLFNGTGLADHEACGEIIMGTEKQLTPAWRSACSESWAAGGSCTARSVRCPRNLLPQQTVQRDS